MFWGITDHTFIPIQACLAWVFTEITQLNLALQGNTVKILQLKTKLLASSAEGAC
jgi:hypothetical protein